MYMCMQKEIKYLRTQNMCVKVFLPKVSDTTQLVDFQCNVAPNNHRIYVTQQLIDKHNLIEVIVNQIAPCEAPKHPRTIPKSSSVKYKYSILYKQRIVIKVTLSSTSSR